MTENSYSSFTATRLNFRIIWMHSALLDATVDGTDCQRLGFFFA